MPLGTLTQFINYKQRNLLNGNLSESTIKYIISFILKALLFSDQMCHTIIHRDIKSDNFLLSQ